MIIKVNGENLEIDNQSTAAALIVQLGYQDQRIALEVNEAIISKSKHVEFALNEGDLVEFIQAVGGGKSIQFLLISSGLNGVTENCCATPICSLTSTSTKSSSLP